MRMKLKYWFWTEKENYNKSMTYTHVSIKENIKYCCFSNKIKDWTIVSKNKKSLYDRVEKDLIKVYFICG